MLTPDHPDHPTEAAVTRPAPVRFPSRGAHIDSQPGPWLCNVADGCYEPATGDPWEHTVTVADMVRINPDLPPAINLRLGELLHAYACPAHTPAE